MLYWKWFNFQVRASIHFFNSQQRNKLLLEIIWLKSIKYWNNYSTHTNRFKHNLFGLINTSILFKTFAVIINQYLSNYLNHMLHNEALSMITQNFPTRIQQKALFAYFVRSNFNRCFHRFCGAFWYNTLCIRPTCCYQKCNLYYERIMPSFNYKNQQTIKKPIRIKCVNQFGKLWFHSSNGNN